MISFVSTFSQFYWGSFLCSEILRPLTYTCIYSIRACAPSGLALPRVAASVRPWHTVVPVKNNCFGDLFCIRFWELWAVPSCQRGAISQKTFPDLNPFNCWHSFFSVFSSSLVGVFVYVMWCIRCRRSSLASSRKCCVLFGKVSYILKRSKVRLGKHSQLCFLQKGGI